MISKTKQNTNVLCIVQGTTDNLLLRNFLISPEKRSTVQELDSEVLLRGQQQTPQNPYCGPQIFVSLERNTKSSISKVSYSDKLPNYL